MKRVTSYLLVAALALLPIMSSASVVRSNPITLVANYDLTATSYTYSFFRGPDTANADPTGEGVKSLAKVKTVAGGGTTVSSFTASREPFTGLVAGDLLIFPNAPTVVNSGASAVNVQGITQRQEAVITVATDANNADIDRTIDLSQDATGYNVYWKKFKTGTETVDGWFNCAQWTAARFTIQVTTLNATSIGYSIETRMMGSNLAPEQVDVGTISADTLGANAHTYYMRLPADQCRVGLKVNTDTGAQAVWVTVTGDYEHR